MLTVLAAQPATRAAPRPSPARRAKCRRARARLARIKSTPVAFQKPGETIAHFAPALIAVKPVKPCDGGVLGALNLLLFLQ